MAGLAGSNDIVYAITMRPIPLVIGTNVFVAGLRSEGGASRQVLRRCLVGRYQPQFGNALWQEYQDVLGRDIWGIETSPDERQQVLAALAAVGSWVKIFYGWRPNLPDEADNHLVELALAAGTAGIVTHNVKDLARGELKFAQFRIVTPAECLEVWP